MVSVKSFSQRSGMKTEDVRFSSKLYRTLWKLRAGVEGIISELIW